MNIVNRKQLAEIFNTASTSISNWRDCPKYSRGRWDADEVALYIMKTFPTGKIKQAAKRYLAGIELPANDAQEDEDEISSDSGLIGMMSRMREVEVNISKKYQKSKSGDDFNQWMKICAEMAKAEKQFDEIMIKRGKVISIDDAKAFFFERAIPMKQQLKSFGADVCEDAAIMDDPAEIKTYIDERIMTLMRGID